MGEACSMYGTDENCLCNFSLKTEGATCEYLEVCIYCSFNDAGNPHYNRVKWLVDI
jgi:hypothetical protein